MHFWDNHIKFDQMINLRSQVIRGFGRGGKELGINTGNVRI